MGSVEADLFTRATELLAAELETKASTKDRAGCIAALDLWLLDRVALWTSHDFDTYCRDRLPRILGMLERRGIQLKELQENIEAARD
jgi:hypothetical protein